MTGITPNLNLQTFNQIYGAGYQPSSMVSLPVSSNTAPLNTVPSASAPNLNTNNQLEKTPKSDTITIAGKTIKKKTAIIGGLSALAAAAAIGAAVVFGARKGKVPAVPPEVKMPPETMPAADVVETVTAKAGELVNGAQKEAQELTESIQKEAQELADGIQKEAEELADSIQKEAKDVLNIAQKKLAELTEIFKNGGKDSEGKVVTELVDSSVNIDGHTFTHYDLRPNPDAGIYRASFNDDGKLLSAHIVRDGAHIYCGHDTVPADIGYRADKKRFDFDSDGKLIRYVRYPKESSIGVLDALEFSRQGGICRYEGLSGKDGATKGVQAFFDDGKVCRYRVGTEKSFKLVDGKWVEAAE